MKGGCFSALFGVVALLAGTVAQAQESTTADAEGAGTPAAVYSMMKMMDPATWFQMMAMTMDPRIMANPISTCAACHDNEDVGRYQQVFGPFVATAANPAMWANPGAYNAAMASAMDARAAEHWTRALEKKYGLCAGSTAGCPRPPAHGNFRLPGPMLPIPSMPSPAQ